MPQDYSYYPIPIIINKYTIALFAILIIAAFIYNQLYPHKIDEGKIRVELFRLINDYRVKNGRWSLKNGTSLTIYAEAWADKLAQLGELVHSNPPSEYELWAENICLIYIEGKSEEEIALEAFEGWKNSPGHNRNMLLKNTKYMGIGVSISGDKVIIVVQFASSP